MSAIQNETIPCITNFSMYFHTSLTWANP